MRHILAALFAACLSLPSHAQQACGPYDALREGLERQYSEVVVGRGVGEGGMLMELFASADGKSWTLIIVHPNGMACFAASGGDWQPVEAVRGEGA